MLTNAAEEKKPIPLPPAFGRQPPQILPQTASEARP